MNYFRQCPPNTTPYIIRLGDTFAGLAQVFNTSLSQLLALNPGIDLSSPEVGMQICIPSGSALQTCPGGNTYTVKEGDTINTIALFFNISVFDLLIANPEINQFSVTPGQILCIPVVGGTVCSFGSIPYTIRRGDTFYSIAQRVNTTVDALKAANPNVNPEALLVGQNICIPIPAPHF